MSRLGRLPARVADRLLAMGAFAAGVIEVVATGAADDQAALKMLALAAFTLPLAWRRRAPLPAAGAAFAAAALMTASLSGMDELGLPFMVVLILSYSLGAVPDTGEALAGLALAIAGVALVATAIGDPVVGDYVFPMGFATAAWVAARTVRHRSRLVAELHEAALRANEAREEAAARAVAEERRRIAREMHDVVAHSVSVMVVQAGGARRILAQDPLRAAEAATYIEQAGHAALVEMRRLLGVLHPDEEEPALAPQPTLDRLDALVAGVRDAGLPVTLTVDGDPRPLPAGAEAAVYRIVQEALTNALKHAAAAPTGVTLRWDADVLEIRVADEGAPPGADVARGGGGGHGLLGMRERVRVYGGDLDARPRPGGGFEVSARIPLSPELQTA